MTAGRDMARGWASSADRGWTAAQALDHAATGGIGQGVEQAVERRALVKHLLNVSHAPRHQSSALLLTIAK